MRGAWLALLLAVACQDKRPTSSPASTETAPTPATSSPSSAPSTTSSTSVTSATTASASSSAPPAKSVPPTWLAAAARAPGHLAADAKDEYAKTSPYRHDDAINEVLNRVAAEPATASGIRAAARILEDNGGVGGDMQWAGSGSSPASMLVRAAGLALLADLVTRACATNPSADVSRAIDTIPLPPHYNSVGRSENVARQDRVDLRDAAKRCPQK